MRVIVGGYRLREHYPRCLASLSQYVKGVDDIVFVDDSGDADCHAWLAGYGRVVDVGKRGYGAAMAQVCMAADSQPAMFLEEDFEFLEPVNLDEIGEMLHQRPHLAQIALLRGPHFPIEHEYGGVIEALKAKGHTFNEVDGLIEHIATFTCNPAVWRGHAFDLGWPAVKWSEDFKGKELVKLGYRFAYMPGIRVAHHGERTGFGY